MSTAIVEMFLMEFNRIWKKVKSLRKKRMGKYYILKTH